MGRDGADRWECSDRRSFDRAWWYATLVGGAVCAGPARLVVVGGVAGWKIHRVRMVAV